MVTPRRAHVCHDALTRDVRNQIERPNIYITTSNPNFYMIDLNQSIHVVDKMSCNEKDHPRWVNQEMSQG
jgi:hypothetical protein